MGFLQDWFCGVERMEYAALSARYDALIKDYNALKKDYSELNTGHCTTQLTKAKTTIRDLQETISSLEHINDYLREVGPDLEQNLSEETKKLIKFYNEKYPSADVKYAGRNVPNDTTRSNYSLAVQAFAKYGIDTPEIKDIVEKSKSDVLLIMKEESVDFHKACDISVSRAKVWITQNAPYKYQYDSNTTRNNEFWKFAIETWYSIFKFGIGSDCDDWAALMHVIWRTAGIPAGLLRVSAGITNDGQGHATNHYFASDLEWHHINSTTPYGKEFDATKLPYHDDRSDSIGIRSVWFSFNDKYAWSKGIPLSDAKRIHDEDLHRVFPGILRDISINR